MVRTVAVFAVVALFAVFPEIATGQNRTDRDCGLTLPASVRVIDCRLATVLVDALPRSATLRALTARITELHGVVYVTTAVEIRLANNHRASGITLDTIDHSGPNLLMRVEVERRYTDDAIAVLAHELCHVVEILESVDHHGAGYQVWEHVRETSEAQDIQRRVSRELRLSRPTKIFEMY
jgi:hypothetical protein